jgi:hypothetical protein
MNFKNYENLIKNGVRVDWYGVDVPEELITPLVKFASDGLSHEINKLESELNDSVGTSKEKKKAYISLLKSNLQNLPYTLNGDAYLKKKERIEQTIKETKPTTKKPRKPSTKGKTKNSNLIFGNNKK